MADESVTQEFQRRIVTRLQEDIGRSIIQDTMIQVMAEKAINDMFFSKPSPGSMSWFQAEVDKQVKPLMEKYVRERIIEVSGERIQALVHDFMEEHTLNIMLCHTIMETLKFQFQLELPNLAANIAQRIKQGY